MKKILIEIMQKRGALMLLTLFASISASAQTSLPVNSDGVVTFEEVINVGDSTTAKELYSRALTWFGITFKSARDVIQSQDASSATIVGKGNTNMSWPGLVPTSGYLRFTLVVSAKDGRYKYTFSDLSYQEGSFSYPPVAINALAGKKNKTAEKARKNVAAEINDIVASLKKAMQKGEQW